VAGVLGFMALMLPGHVLAAALAAIHVLVVGIMAHLHLLVMPSHRRCGRWSGLGSRHGRRCDQYHHF